MSALRFATPGQLLMCLILFFLPWIEVQCRVPDLKNTEDNQTAVWDGISSQSGFQAATGKQALKPAFRAAAKSEEHLKAAEKATPAPILWAYLGAVIAGVVVGLACPPDGLRKAALVSCCVLALASVGSQTTMGFPVEKDWADEIKKQEAEQAKYQRLADDILELSGEPKQNTPQETRSGTKPTDALRTSYKAPFYLSLLFAIGALLSALFEPIRRAVAKPGEPRAEEGLEIGQPLDDEDQK
jgi:hypothetical protein